MHDFFSNAFISRTYRFITARATATTRGLGRALGGLLLVVMLPLTGSLAAAGSALEGRVVNTAGEAEAGVWVVAETADLPTDYRKIVVTGDDGRFVVPDLPTAEQPLAWQVWARGYGIADSERMTATPDAAITLTVETADADEAALVYPASYWLALANINEDLGALDGSPYAEARDWFAQFKLNCILCHQVGAAPTRLAGREAFHHGLLKSQGMNDFAHQLGRERLLDMLDAWSARIADGALPTAPPRPRGIERNFVITQWGWGDGYTYAHDEIATDKRDPTVNAGGPVWGVDLGNDYLLKLDPRSHTASRIRIPTRDGFDTPWCEQTFKGLDDDEVSPFGFGSLGCPAAGGATPHADRYNNPANPHNPMMDGAGRIWMTTQIRRQWAEDLPAFCRHDPTVADQHHHRQLGYYDPSKEQFALVDTCFGTHHLQFDQNDRLYTSGDVYVVGWLDTKRYDPANPATLEQALDYSAVWIDSDGDKKPDQPMVGFRYGLIPNPHDGSLWSAVPPGLATTPGQPGRIERFDPATGTHEVYSPPAPGMGPRGIDIDTSGVIWTALAGSGHLARFDRRRCKQHWGTGAQCAEGWTLWSTPGPDFAGVNDDAGNGSIDMHYYLWVDQFNTLGLGKDVVIINGTGSDSLIAFEPDKEKFTVIRIPYPLNSYTRGLDGRIDDADAGWKGRGLWYTNGIDPVVHAEVPRSYVGQVQLRPHPLAK